MYYLKKYYLAKEIKLSIISRPSLIFSYLFVTIPKLICAEVLEAFAILSAILLPTKSPVFSVVFRIAIYI